MKVLVAYDLNIHQDIVKEKLIKEGFQDFCFDENRVRHELPQSTLFHSELKHTVEARKLFDSTIIELNKKPDSNDQIEINRFVAVQVDRLFY